MKVALVDVDDNGRPNLALMKISAYHKAQGDEVDLVKPVMAWAYDKTYASKVFMRSPMPLLPQNSEIGGSGTHDIKKKLPADIDVLCPDYELYGLDYSLGYFTRGCIRRCPWCIVPEKEGDISAYASIDDFIRHDKAVLMDNNVLAHPHGIEQIEEVARRGIKIDFNQGLDARLIDGTMARLLKKVKWLKPVRLACDNQQSKKAIEQAVKLMRSAGVTPSRYFVYCLITDDIDEALDRVHFLESLRLDIFAQPYRDIKGNEPSHMAKELATWCNKPAFRKTRTFQNFYEYRNRVKQGGDDGTEI